MMVFCDAFKGDLIGNPVANFRSTILYALGDIHCWLVATNLTKIFWTENGYLKSP